MAGLRLVLGGRSDTDRALSDSFAANVQTGRSVETVQEGMGTGDRLLQGNRASF